MTKREVYELLMIEEADAWFEYLEATREKMPNRYDELEPWAWARLNQRLRLVRRRRRPSCRRPPAQARRSDALEPHDHPPLPSDVPTLRGRQCRRFVTH